MIGEDKANATIGNDTPDPNGESRRKRKSMQLVRNNATGVYTNQFALWWVRNPSARLQCIVSLHFNPDSNQPDPANVSGWTSTADAWTRTQDGFWLPTNSIIPGPAVLSPNLPWSYEATTMVDRIQGLVSIPNAPGTNSPPGFLYLTAAWEPVSGAVIGDGELAAIFKQCAIGGDVTTSSTTGA